MLLEWAADRPGGFWQTGPPKRRAAVFGSVQEVRAQRTAYLLFNRFAGRADFNVQKELINERKFAHRAIGPVERTATILLKAIAMRLGLRRSVAFVPRIRLDNSAGGQPNLRLLELHREVGPVEELQHVVEAVEPGLGVCV